MLRPESRQPDGREDVAETNETISQWWFDPTRAGTMGTSGLRSLLDGTHLEGPELFVREATQNSVDAHLTKQNAPVRMRFSSFALTPSQHEALRAFLVPSEDIAARARSVAGIDGFAEDGGFFLRQTASQPPTRVLAIEDFETRGLGGKIGKDGADDHFSRLVYFYGQSHGEGTQGGAFGFGKSVYSVASAVRTVIYYSRPIDGAPSRAIAVSLFPRHEHDETAYTGYALCGRASNDAQFPIQPLEGEEADRLAQSIGLSMRGETESGTSLMVLDANYAMSDIRSALEKWWWPRIVTTGPKGLNVELVEDGQLMAPPRPSAREDLEPFVRAYQHLLDGRGDAQDVKSDAIRSVGKRIVGRYVLRRTDERDDDDPNESEPWHLRHVALMRGPRLVVNYLPAGHDHMTPFVGVFVADESMDGTLRKAENPAHDTWSAESQRVPDDERVLVRSVEKNLKAKANDFQSTFEARPVASNSRLRALEDLLGRVFLSGKTPGPVPQGVERPVSISVKERRLNDQDVDEASIEVTSKRTDETLPCRLHVSAHVLADTHHTQLDRLPVKLLDEHERVIAEGVDPEHAFDLPPGERMRFQATTTGQMDSIVRFSVKVVGRNA